MRHWNDAELLSAYANQQSEAAFGVLVERYIALVYSAAQRQVQNLQLAEEVTQAVFIILAQKAQTLSQRAVLSGWLCRTAHFVARNAVKAECRRQRREQEAHMQSLANESDANAWAQLAPMLDEAVAHLNDTDRDAVVLRFYEQKPLIEVGNILGVNPDVAQKRVSRAVDKLRKFFVQRGVALSAVAIAGALTANTVQAAPMGLAITVTATAAKGAAIGGSTLTLIKEALKVMAWTKAKTAIVTGAALLLVGGTTTVIVKKSGLIGGSDPYEVIFANPNSSSMAQLESAPPTLIVRPTRYPDNAGGIWSGSGKGVWVNGGLDDLVGFAYGFGKTRMILPNDMPTGAYDYLATLPSGQNEALREEIKKQFRLVAHRETRQTDVLLLKVRNPGLLKASVSKGDRRANYVTGDSRVQKYIFADEQCSRLVQSLEGYMEKPTLDRTGTPARYDWTFEWKTKEGGESRDARMERIRQALIPQLEHFGLELVPSRETIEMLVVEKVQ